MRNFLILFFFIIINLNRIEGYLIALPILLYGLGLLDELVFNQTKTTESAAHKSFGAYVLYGLLLVSFVSLFRTNYTVAPYVNAMRQALAAALVVLYFMIVIRRELADPVTSLNKAKSLLVKFMCSMALYIALNLLLFFLDIMPASPIYLGPNMLLGFFNIQMERVLFPVSEGIVNFASFAGTLLTLSVLGLLTERNMALRALFAVFGLLALVSMFLTDSRTSLLNALLAVILIQLLKNRPGIGSLKYLAMLTPALPILFILLINLFVGIPFFEQFARSSSDFETGNSRLFIWGIAFIELLDFKWIHLIGWGEFGQYASGCSIKWAALFNGKFEYPEFTSPHNIILQFVFNTGYIGALLFLISLWIGIKRGVLFSKMSSLGLLLIAFFVYYDFSGITDAVFMFYSNGFFLYLVMLCIVLFVLPESLVKERSA